MSAKKAMVRPFLVFVLLVGLGVLPVLAASAVVGSVAGSLNTTMGGRALEPVTISLEERGTLRGRLLEAETGKPIAEPMQHDAGVLAAVFSPDERRVLTAAGDYDRPGSLYNALLLIGPQGLLWKHRKLMPTHHEKLFHGFGKGDDLQVTETPVGREVPVPPGAGIVTADCSDCPVAS